MYKLSFNMELAAILDEVIKWSKNFRMGKQNYNFDFDNKLFFLSEKHQISFEKNSLKLVYDLLDFYCDAIKHEFKEIEKGYSIISAEKDIQKITHLLQNQDTLNFELDKDIKDRLSKIFK